MAEASFKKAIQSKYSYSPQALAYLRAIHDIDLEDFEDWRINTVHIGGGDIMSYVLHKQREKDTERANKENNPKE